MKHIDADDVSSHMRAHQRQVHEALRNASREAAYRGEALLVRETPADTGEARRGWRVILTPDGADVVNDAPHVLVLEMGSRPHRPPLEPILRWVMRVAFDGASFDDIADVPDEAMAMARAVVESIAKHGTEPRHFIRGSMPKLGKILARVTQLHLDQVQA